MNNPLALSILKFLDADRHKWHTDKDVIKEFNLEKIDFDNAIVVLKMKGFIKDEFRSSFGKWFKITDTGIYYLLEQPLPNALPQQGKINSEKDQQIFINNFDNISPTEIYKHFKAGLVEKGYLTEQELIRYLKVAFELKTIPETLFKIKNAPTKTIIEAVFYTYYKDVAGKIHGKQNQYAALLGDYFEGYKTATVSSNFSKSVY